MKQKFIIGIDEAGRGPLAGPVAVGVVLVPADFDWTKLPGVGDSKALSEKKREQVYKAAMSLAHEGELFFSVQMGSAKTIDKNGISVVIKECIDKGLSAVSFDYKKSKHTDFQWGSVRVKLDGSLKAPEYCLSQETIIKGDSKEKVIGLASILAKVTRDRYMQNIASKAGYSQYEFAQHKGYGTKQHRELIAQHGHSIEHRKTFCRNIKLVV